MVKLVFRSGGLFRKTLENKLGVCWGPASDEGKGWCFRFFEG